MANPLTTCPACGSAEIGTEVSMPMIQTYTRYKRFVAWIRRKELPWVFYPSVSNWVCMKCDKEWGHG